MFDKNNFCKRLKEAREAAGVTQKQIAQEMGILQPAYNRFERGVHQLSYEQLYFLANRFHVSIDYLFDFKEYQ